MNTKLILFLLFFFALTINANAIPHQIYLSYGLVSSIDDDKEYMEKIPRIPALQLTATIDDNLLTFPSFSSDFRIELYDASTNEIAFHANIPAGVAFCTLDPSLQGTYIIQFIFGSYMYWGYITL